MDKELEKSCMRCVYRSQGNSHMVCGNINQPNQDLKEYIYWSHTCDLFEHDIKRENIDGTNPKKD